MTNGWWPCPIRSGRPIHRRPATAYWQELLTLVAAGHGVTICAAQGARYYARPDLVYRPLADAAPLEYGLVWSAVGIGPMGREFARLGIEKFAAPATGTPRPTR
nr:LysR substrate-binding domain-containing protein [Nocardia cyriacigeorgica]